MRRTKSKSAGDAQIGMVEQKISNGREVLIQVSNSDDASKEAFSESINGTTQFVSVNPPCPEISSVSMTPSKPPKIPTTNNEGLTKRKSLNRSVYSKPKSRFVEQSYPVDHDKLEKSSSTLRDQFGANSFSRSSFNRASSPNNNSARSIETNPITPKTPAVDGKAVEDKDEDEEIYKMVKLSKEKSNRVMSKTGFVELVLFLCLVGFLAASLTVRELKKLSIWGLEIWNWCVLVLVIFSGKLLTKWFMHFVVFLIEKNFLLRKKVLYFVHGLKKSVQVFIWLSLVLIAWLALIKRGVKSSKTAAQILDYITWTLISLLLGASLWLVKTLLLKILASNLNVNNFFDRIQESLFHQYVLQTLSGPPLIEEGEKVGREPSSGSLSFRGTKKGKRGNNKKVIDMGKVHKMKQEKVSAWTMKVLVEAVRTSGLSTISNTLDESDFVDRKDQTDKEITNEMEAIAAAYDIFTNVAQFGNNCIEEDDLLRFMIKEEVDLVLPLIEGTETGRITRKALTDWVVKVYVSRKALGHSLNDTKTAVKQLNKLVSAVLIVIMTVVWLLLMGIATTKFLLFLSSQFVALAFMIGSSCKTLFESIIFVFVMHPFDVGDRCVVDGVPLMVEEMNLLTTVFLKLNNEKVFYPNSVLATKPISNYYRSPEMGDTVEFSIDFTTPLHKIALLKDRIKQYLEGNPQHWQPTHTVVVKEIENVNMLKMALFSNHTINFQEFREKNLRRTELVIGIKTMFEDLGIKYHLLPQQVHLTQA